MRFGKKIQIAASIASMAVLAAVTTGCEKRPTQEQLALASRTDSAASRAEAAASKAEQAARNAADAAARAQAAADKAEAMFQRHIRK